MYYYLKNVWEAPSTIEVIEIITRIEKLHGSSISIELSLFGMTFCGGERQTYRHA